MTTQQWITFVISLLTPVATLIGFAWNNARNGGMSAAEAANFKRDVAAHATAIDNLKEAMISQREINSTRKAWELRKESRLDLLETTVNQMKGREEGREHRER